MLGVIAKVRLGDCVSTGVVTRRGIYERARMNGVSWIYFSDSGIIARSARYFMER